ncbi:unnamed protein product [Nesidiocoris tenuis]|uniref:Uncharacterized protein n=1 Tax=Nesidiocoris tenuis TaxID=355587 RepID=A0A6H5GHF7_9HEMI|nr:unnamed protein product [Nesidiocoris tenuis]
MARFHPIFSKVPQPSNSQLIRLNRLRIDRPDDADQRCFSQYEVRSKRISDIMAILTPLYDVTNLGQPDPGLLWVCLIERTFRKPADNRREAFSRYPNNMRTRSTEDNNKTNLPSMAAVAEPDFPTGGVRTLSDRVAMQCETVRFDVHVPGTIVRVPRVVKSSQLGLVRRHRAEEIGFERFLRQLPDAVQSPYVVVFIVQKTIPPFAD